MTGQNPSDSRGNSGTRVVAESGGKKPAVIIVSMILAVVALFAALYTSGVLPLGDGNPLDAAIEPSQIDVAAGHTNPLSVEVTWRNSPIDGDKVVYCIWNLTPSSLGRLASPCGQKVEFEAGRYPGEGTIQCTVTCENHTALAICNVTVLEPVLEYVEVSPPVAAVLPDAALELSAQAFDSIDEEIPDAEYQWIVLGMDPSEFDISQTVGQEVMFVGKALGQATLVATVSSNGLTTTGSVDVDVVSRLVATRWYDMFEVPFADYWYTRFDVYGNVEPLTDTYPYLYRSYSRPTMYESTIHASMRLDLTARNITNINMLSNPLFLPLFGESTGGNAEIDWHLTYVSSYDELFSSPLRAAESGPLTASAMCFSVDGWEVKLTGNVTLDKEAAKAVLGINDTQYAQFSDWWDENGDNYSDDYFDWLDTEGNQRHDIYCMYEYPLTLLSLRLDAQQKEEGIVLSYYVVGWGLEALMARWLQATVLPTEWYFENLSLQARIGPAKADFDINTVVVNAVHAVESRLDESPCWMWQGMLQDFVPSTRLHPDSDFDAYAELEYEDRYAGSGTHSLMIDYDYTPGCYNLSEGEVLVLEWPEGTQLFLLAGGDNSWNTTNVSGPMTLSYGEPLDIDLAHGRCIIDKVAREVTFVGPVDFWSWSRDQTSHPCLEDEWGRLGLLPYGMPYIEFGMDSLKTSVSAAAMSSEDASTAGSSSAPSSSQSPDTPGKLLETLAACARRLPS